MARLEELPVAGTVVISRSSASGREVLMMRRPDRGSFASAWVFPGGRVEDEDRGAGDASEQAAAERAAIREVQEEVGLVVSDLTAVSVWTPPPGIPTRIRTWFFLAETSSGELRASADEVAETCWIAPEAALARHAAGEWTLFPPTWITLHALTAGDGATSAIGQGVRTYETRIEGTAFQWEGLRLETVALPWVLSVEEAL